MFRKKFWLYIGIGGFCGFFFILGVIILWATTLPIPTPDSFNERRVSHSTRVFDRTGEIVLYDFVKDRQQEDVSIINISRNIQNAFIVAEDKNFYNHFGIEPVSIVRAFFVNIFFLDLKQGGSTITQQLIKNTLLTTDKTLTRKLKEWVLSIKIEQSFSKNTILEWYLNEIPFGGTIYGVEEVSQSFFNKSAKDVTLAESAYLASLPKAPSYYSPYGTNRDKLEERKNSILQKMLLEKFITSEEYEEAINEKVVFLPKNQLGDIKAPHFVFYIKEEVEKLLKLPSIETAGLSIVTTLDYELQKELGEDLYEYALLNEERVNAENAGFVGIESGSGEILVMIGSRNYFDTEIDGEFNIATAKRQPGSTFKPFAYAEAFNKKYTPETILFDVPTEFNERCLDILLEIKKLHPNSEMSIKELEEEYFLNTDVDEEDLQCYSPGNYDNVFRGPVTMREALAQSINLPSVKTLFLAGLFDTYNLIKRMGITSLSNPLQYGLTLVLGGGEVSLLELTSAYGVFANDGKYVDSTGILYIQDSQEKIIYRSESRPRQVLATNTARTINDILSDNEARSPAFGIYSPLSVEGYQVAAKTGTTNDYRDAWTVGYSPHIVGGVWAGNNDNTPINKRTGLYVVTPLWNKLFTKLLEKYESKESVFIKPSPIIEKKGAGVLYGNIVLDQNKPHSILHYVSLEDTLTPPTPKQLSSLSYQLWEFGVEEWLQYNSISNFDVVSDTPFDASTFNFGNSHIFNTPQQAAHNPGRISVDILFPENNQDFGREVIVVVPKTSSGGVTYELFINNNFSAASSHIFQIQPGELKRGKNTISVVGRDSFGNVGRSSIEILYSGF